MIPLPEIARALDGEVAGRQVLAPGPNHSRRDRSLAVMPSDSAPDGFVLHSHAGDDWRTCRDHVAARLGIVRDQRPVEQHPFERLQERARQAKAEQAERDKRIAKAARLWTAGSDPRGTIVEAYLTSRGLRLPDELAVTQIRFHPAGAWYDDTAGNVVHIPMMVTAMRNIVTNDITGVHRTGLTPDGAKIGRRMLGIAGGTAIKLDSDDAVTAAGALTIGEGIESTLSGRTLGHGPAWALASVVGIESFPVLVGVRRLNVLEELNDGGASARAVAKVSARWTAAGREVFATTPTIGNDMNDQLQGSRA